MDRKAEIFENVLTSPFSNKSFVGFIREFLQTIELVAPNQYHKEYSHFSFYVDGYYHIGNYESDSGDKIAVFSVCLKRGETVERARGMQRNFVKPLIERGGCAGAIVAFFTLDRQYENRWAVGAEPGKQVEADKWRLSFIRLDYEFSKGKVAQKLTPAKRYSYLVGKGEPCHTAKERLYPIFRDDVTMPGVDDLEEAFSVERVTKEFFDRYREKYHDVKEWLESNEDFVQEARLRNFTSEQFTKKLLGQIVFLYFIQKKGWLGVDAIPVTMTEREYNDAYYRRGAKSREMIPKAYARQENGTYHIVVSELQKLSDEDESFLAGIVKGKPWGSGPKDFMRRIFQGCAEAGKNYFDDYLEPLFYTGLNKNRGENGFYAPLHRRIPFLNGGLFEPIDNYEWENNNFAIPNSLFSNADEKGRDADGILDIFDRYNFTMNEDEPMEREVAIDPEMLGKVFENLLDVTDRKSKGAFYTPREIVHYMCQESIIHYLTTKTGISEAAIREYILYGEYFKDEDVKKTAFVAGENGEKGHYEFDYEKDLLLSEEILSFKKRINRLQEIDDALANIRVADLAVGSGAFPLGMLNEIVKARDVLSAYLSIGRNGFERKVYLADRKLYNLKINTIKNCIFACDIEPSAVDIAKLRLWLSIVIDDEIAETADNDLFDEHTKPRQLPNLDCNIICGNSLIDEFRGVKLLSESDLLHNVSDGAQMTVHQSGFDILLGELIELQDKLFFVKEHDEKEEIKRSIQNIYNQIVVEQLQGDAELVEAYYESLEEPSRPFVIWQLYFSQVFRDNGGFDVVIGNPPYLESRSPDFSNQFKDQLQRMIKRRYGNNAKWFSRGADLLIYFFELSLRLINKDGINAFITQNSWLATEFGKKFQEYLLYSTDVLAIIDSDYKYFETADINTVISFMQGKEKQKSSLLFARCHKNLRNYSVPASANLQIDSDLVSYKIIDYDSEMLKNMKWGFIFDTENRLMDLIERVNCLGKTIDKMKGFSIGQGLNLKKSAIFTEEDIKMNSELSSVAIPFFVTEESGYYSWQNATHYLISKENTDDTDIEKITKNRDLFDKSSTSKVPPVLILPRGIGARHYCCYNSINGYSASCVDIYSTDGIELTDDVLRLWFYMNSSLFWLIRETVGRTNLGGGMLKAEAVDIKPFSILFPFEITDTEKRIYYNSQKHKIKNAQLEIKEDIHREIDMVVFDYFHFSNDDRDYICKRLVEKINARNNKTKSKR